MDANQTYAYNVLSHRRGESELLRDRKVKAYYDRYPQLQKFDSELRIAKAELLLAMADDPYKVKDRSILEEIREKRNQYLKEQGIPEDYDQIIPFCPLCNDLGYKDHKPCVCFKELMIPKLLAASGLDNYRDVSFSHHQSELFSHPERMNQIRDISVAFARALPEKSGNLLFWGNPGTGKTFMAVCIAKEAVMRGVPTIVVRVTEILEMLSEYRTLMNSFSPDQERLRALTEKRDLVMQGDLLVVDEFGVEPKGQNTIPDLLNVFGTRKQRGLSTIITTNLSPTNIQNQYDNRLYSRLFGDFDPFRFEGADLRTKRRM